MELDAFDPVAISASSYLKKLQRKKRSGPQVFFLAFAIVG